MSEVFDKPWIPQAKDYEASLIMQAFGIRYIGTAASGIVTSASTGDLAFLHGVAASEAADTTVNPAGATPGTLDLVGAVAPEKFPTYKSILDMVNASGNWEMWLIGARPEAVSHITTVGNIVDVTGTNGDCGGSGSSNKDTGYIFTFDESVALMFAAGLTVGGPSVNIHNSDSGVEWKCHRVSAKATHGGSATLKLYACNDQAGTSRVLKTFTPGATTVEVLYPAEATPAVENHGVTLGGERLVLEFAAASITGTGILDLMSLHGEYRIVSPISRKSSMNPELIR